jgi:2-haloacid dehalogenase
MISFDRFEVVSFDCYGTLVDWESGILDAVRPILASHDLFPSDERLLEYYAEAESEAEKGPYAPYKDVLRRAFGGLLSRLGVAASSGEVDLLARSLGEWPPFPDTAAALRALKSRYRIAVISNTDDDLFALTAQSLGVAFDGVVTAEQARSYKPDPAVFRRALAAFGVPKERLLHAAQSLFHDVAPAQGLGIATAWVNRRAGRPGPGATPPAQAAPDLAVPDLATLASLALGG